MSSGRNGSQRQGIVLPLVFIGALIFAILMFSLKSYQSHEMGALTMTLGRQRALASAEAGIQRAMARYVAKPYQQRWYKTSPGGPYVGTFSSDDAADDDPTASTMALDPNGRYDVYVADLPRSPVGVANPPATQADYDRIQQESKLDHTDMFALGIYSGFTESRVLIYARAAIVPEPLYYAPSGSPSETLKRIYIYRVFFDREIASLDPINVKADRDEVVRLVERDMLAYHLNFLRTRACVDKLRTAPINVPAGKTSFTKAEAIALFGAYPPIVTTNFDLQANAARNQFVDSMVRLYQIEDNIGPNQNLRYELPPAAKANPGLPAGAENVRRVFFPDKPIHTIHSDFLLAPSEVDTGDRLIEVQDVQLDFANENYMTRLSHCYKYSFNAVIPTGNVEVTTDGPQYLNNVHLDRFNTGPPWLDASYVSAMDADATHVPGTYGKAMESSPVPIDMVYTDNTATEHRLAVSEFLRFYMKYINSTATFVGGTIVDAPPPTPPPTGPPPTPPPPTGGGGGGGGGGGSPPPPPPISGSGVGGGGWGG